MKKRWILGLSLLASLFVGVAWLCWPQPRISPASFERIHEGMSQDQIEAIIGLPPGDYYTGPRGVGGSTSRGPFGFPCVEKGRPWGKQTGRVISRQMVGIFCTYSLQSELQPSLIVLERGLGCDLALRSQGDVGLARPAPSGRGWRQGPR